MALPRAYISPSITLPTSKAPSSSFPGLLSSLRPIKRAAENLSLEAALLRRFTYKNKNQHKGSGWWWRVIEVDRAVGRVGSEVEGLLGEFGWSVEDKEDGARIELDAIIKGLGRLPRSAALLTKFNSIILNCTSILDQLVESRAFLPFSVVLVALISRLHALSTVLLSELARLSTVLVKLAFANSILPLIKTHIRTLPRTLQSFVVFDPSPTSAAPPESNAPTPIGSPDAVPRTGDEIGAVISRPSVGEHPTRSVQKGAVQKSASIEVPDLAIEGHGTDAVVEEDEEGGGREEKDKEQEEGNLVIEKRRKAATGRGDDELGQKVRRKKKRKGTGAGDEIDDIFG